MTFNGPRMLLQCGSTSNKKNVCSNLLSSVYTVFPMSRGIIYGVDLIFILCGFACKGLYMHEC